MSFTSDSYWSMAGPPVNEIAGTLLIFGLSMPTAGLERSVLKGECRVPVLNSHVACEPNGRHLAHSSHSKALIPPDAQANSPLIHPPPETPPAPPSPVKGAACLALGTGRARLAVYLSIYAQSYRISWPAGPHPSPLPVGEGARK